MAETLQGGGLERWQWWGAHRSSGHQRQLGSLASYSENDGAWWGLSEASLALRTWTAGMGGVAGRL